MFKKYGDNLPIQVIQVPETEINPTEVQQSLEQLHETVAEQAQQEQKELEIKQQN